MAKGKQTKNGRLLAVRSNDSLVRERSVVAAEIAELERLLNIIREWNEMP